MNPFIEMEKYPREKLDKMNIEELLAAQRSVLYPEEQKIFDNKEYIFLKLGDGREEFLDYTDMLITNRMVEND